MAKIVSLNFIKNDDKNNSICVSPSNYPILYYWDGQETVFDAMIEEIGFVELLTTQYFTLENYSNISIYMNEYNLDNNEYDQEIVELQKKLPLTLDILHNLAYTYIETILIDLYKISMKEDYKLIVESHIDNIINIYTILKDKYKERISQETLKQYILSQLQQKYKLNNFNCEYVIKLYNDILS